MDLGWPEILIIALVVFALFGYKKLPDATRSLGRSLRIFKAETKGLRDDEPSALEPPRPEATGAAAPTSHDQPVSGSTAGSDNR